MSDLIGQMKKVCTLLINTGQTSTTGGGTDSYSSGPTTRGYLKRDSGDRGQQFGDIVGQNTWTLIVRVQAQITVNLGMGVKWLIDNKRFTVQSWEDINQEGFYYKFKLTQDEF